MNCPKCGRKMQGGTRICSSCGTVMDKGASRTSRASGSKNAGFFDKLFQPKPFRDMPQAAIQTRTTYHISWLALLFAIAMYYVASVLMKLPLENKDAPHILLPTTSLVAVACWLAGIIVSKKALKIDNLKLSESYDQMRQHIYTYGIISMALCESAAIFGLALGLFGFQIIYTYGFFILAAIGLLLHYFDFKPAWDYLESNRDRLSGENDK